MINLFNRVKKNKELEEIMLRIVNNESNNYKDAAQNYLKIFEKRYMDLCENGKLKDKQREYYGEILNQTKTRMVGYTHKDQKPYWT